MTRPPDLAVLSEAPITATERGFRMIRRWRMVFDVPVE